jgi:hypothetical protein
MATVEIAKIQVRRGQANVDGVPQLDSGEMGWAVDTQELFIGNGTLEEGAPTIGNTRILTEYDRPAFFDITEGTYVYDADSLIPKYTDPSGQTSTQITVQQKLDSWVTMVDFGVVPGDPQFASEGIQNAINQLYLNLDKNSVSPSSKAILKIPAGRYAITSTIFVPPNVTIVGDGQSNTILSMVNTNTTLMQFCDMSSVPGSAVVFEPGSNNITSGGRPANINLRDLTFQYSSSITDPSQVLPLLRADCVDSASIIDCSFRGTTATTETNYSAIEIRGQGVITTQNLTIDRVDFSSLSRAIISDYDINDLVIKNSTFKNLDLGISFNENPAINNLDGPVKVSVENSQFENIKNQAWYVGTNSSGISTMMDSTKNTYINVGNQMAGDLAAVTPVISFLTTGNHSNNDRFSRKRVINSTSTAAIFVQEVQGPAQIVNNQSFMHSVTDVTTATLFKTGFDSVGQQIEVNYLLRKPVAQIKRRGKLLVNINTNSTAVVTDQYSYTGASDGVLAFTAEVNTVTNTIFVNYNSIDADGTIEYQYNIYN